ncbi:MAG: type II toxin-antitoxin system VapC family toxin [Planctomycetes bacterium]|nr:type II toxin-antitoxin system VapC family toxin [Planctomycetota bacterium]
MTRYFADSFYYLALLNPRDEAHRRAAEFTREIERPVVTTAWILTEVGDALAAPQQRPAFVDLVDDLRVDPEVEIVPPTADLFHRGIVLFRDRPDKHWSLTDCISFVVMRERGLTDALTGDHHFEQGGFRALLK